MKGRNLNIKDSIKSLERKGVVFEKDSMIIPENKHLGNSSWGLVDFLRKNSTYKRVQILDKNNKVKILGE
jgi:hypothetical protein